MDGGVVFLWKLFNWREYRNTVKNNTMIEEHNKEVAKHNSKLLFEMMEKLKNPYISEVEKNRIRDELSRYVDSFPEDY